MLHCCSWIPPQPINLCLCFSQTSVGRSSVLYPLLPQSSCKLKYLAQIDKRNEFPLAMHVLLMGVDDLDTSRFPSSINCHHSSPPAAKSVTWPRYTNTHWTIKVQAVGVSFSVHFIPDAWRRVNSTLQSGKCFDKHVNVHI